MQSPWHSEQSVLKEGHVLGGGQAPQPMFANLPRFDFLDRLNTLDRLQRKKTFRGVNPRPRFPRQVASCHAVNFLGYFRLSQQQSIFFEFSFVILDQFDTSKH